MTLAEMLVSLKDDYQVTFRPHFLSSYGYGGRANSTILRCKKGNLVKECIIDGLMFETPDRLETVLKDAIKLSFDDLDKVDLDIKLGKVKASDIRKEGEA